MELPLPGVLLLPVGCFQVGAVILRVGRFDRSIVDGRHVGMAVHIPKSGLVDAAGGKLTSIVLKIFLVGHVLIITTRILLRHAGEKGINK